MRSAFKSAFNEYGFGLFLAGRYVQVALPANIPI
jgi:hypothetical protein